MAGQQITDFWRPIEGPPHDQATYFTITVDEQDQLYVGTDKGLFITSDLGHSWKEILSADFPIIRIVTSGDYFYAITLDRNIYISPDKGNSWHWSLFNPESEITDFIVLPDKSLLLSTGHIEVQNDVGYFRGNGLYKSIDHGESWFKLDIGLTKNHYIAHLAQDSKGRIYASINEYNSKDGAILYSQDQGKNWYKLPPVSFNWGQNNIGSTEIVQISSMAIDQRDNLVIGMLGATGTVATSVNLKNSFQGALDGTEWQHIRMVPFGYDWFYLEAHQLFFPSNGSVFASRIGQSFNLSGIFHNSGHEQAEFEKRQIDPVFLGEIPNFTHCTFAETSNNRVFVVQELDNVIYYTDLEEVPLGNGEDGKSRFTIFPNPFRDSFHIELNETIATAEVKLYDLEGSLLYAGEAINTDLIEIRTEIKSGMYLVRISVDGITYNMKVIKL